VAEDNRAVPSPGVAGRSLVVRRERFLIRGGFRISRGSKTEAEVVVAEIRDGSALGRGEGVPYARYGETPEGVVATLEQLSGAVAAGLDREALGRLLPAGAARNALDCALWDLEARLTRRPVWRCAGLSSAPEPVVTCFTLSLDAPAAMAAAARAAEGRPLLKLKLDAEDVLQRVRAVRAAVPGARLIVDANEAWTLDQLQQWASELAALGVELIEQPLPAAADALLPAIPGPVPLAADESCHGRDSLARLVGRYQLVNIKLDKTGGLTEALRLKAAAEAAGFGIMVGCMVASSLAMAPALLVAQGAAVIDLDGPLLLAADRNPGLRYQAATVYPPEPALWG
jgi:L-alanine-DL-glutamate epimerase-like enolase superfamily enzyme